MSEPSLEDLERRLQELPREAWDRPVPPPAPWPAEDSPAPRRRRLILRPLAAAAASVALVAAGLGAGVLLAGDGADPQPNDSLARVDLKPVDGRGQGATGIVSLEPRAGRKGERQALRTAAEGGDFYELWLLGDGGELVSLGSVRVPSSGRATLENVQLPVDPERFRFLDVSREPADGDPGHSSISVLRGPSA
jgi:anti-sigma-K factor RskA